MGKFAYGHVPDMTTMEACHRSLTGRLQLLKQKHSSRQGEQWGEPAEMEASLGWLQEEHLELGGPGWAPAHHALVTLGHFASQVLSSLQKGSGGNLLAFEERQPKREKSVQVRAGKRLRKAREVTVSPFPDSKSSMCCHVRS